MSALVFPGLQESDLVGGESWRKGSVALSQQLRGSWGNCFWNPSWVGMKNTGSQRWFGSLRREYWEEKGRNAQLAVWGDGQRKAQGQKRSVQNGCDPADCFWVAWTKQGSRDRPGRTQMVVAKGFLPCLWLLCTLTQLFGFFSVLEFINYPSSDHNKNCHFELKALYFEWSLSLAENKI